MKKIAATFLAPSILPIAFFFGKMLAFDKSSSHYLRDTSFEAFSGILPFSYIFSFMFGVPAVLALSKIRKLNTITIGVGGILGGLLSLVLVLVITRNVEAIMKSGFLIFLAAASGLIVSTTFCVLARIPFRS